MDEINHKKTKKKEILVPLSLNFKTKKLLPFLLFFIVKSKKKRMEFLKKREKDYKKKTIQKKEVLHFKKENHSRIHIFFLFFFFLCSSSSVPFQNKTPELSLSLSLLKSCILVFFFLENIPCSFCFFLNLQNLDFVLFYFCFSFCCLPFINCSIFF